MLGVAMRHEERLATLYKRKKTMSKVMIIGLDLAKNVFHVIACDRHEKVVRKKMLRRRETGKLIPGHGTHLYFF